MTEEIKKLWHDISEQPEFGRELLIVDMHEHCRSVRPTKQGWEKIILAMGTNRIWAYQDDLVPPIKDDVSALNL